MRIEDHPKNTNYTDSSDKPGFTVIPSARSSSSVGAVDKSGLQANGFDPHAPHEQIIDPDSADPLTVKIWGKLNNGNSKVADAPQSSKKHKGNKSAMAASNKQNFSDPAEVRPTTAVKPAINQKLETVYLHVPGAKVPFKINELYVNLDNKVLAIVIADSLVEGVPTFDVTTDDAYITLSDENTIYFCAYAGQEVPLRNGTKVIVFIVLKSQPKT
jgi:hypothetical protein